MAGHSMTSTAAPVGPQQHIFGFTKAQFVALCVMFVALIVAPFFLYPVFLMKLLCFALFACAFNLLIGYVGLTSFGHAAYFGMGGYIAAHSAKVWGLRCARVLPSRCKACWRCVTTLAGARSA